MKTEKKETTGAAAAKAAVAPNSSFRYIHEPYDRGLVITELANRLVRPLDMTDDEIDALIEEYPPAAAWFER